MSENFSRYDWQKKTQSVYCYKGTDVLINKGNIKNAEYLARYEADITMLRQIELENENPVRGKFGVAHLRNIHKYIFQDGLHTWPSSALQPSVNEHYFGCRQTGFSFYHSTSFPPFMKKLYIYFSLRYHEEKLYIYFIYVHSV